MQVAYSVVAPKGKAALVQGQPTTINVQVCRPLLALLVLCIPTTGASSSHNTRRVRRRERRLLQADNA